MPILSRLFQWIPNPFIKIRQHLHIEKQWQQFKHHVKPHRFKIYLGFAIVMYPVYSPHIVTVKDWLNYQLSHRINSLLGVEHAPFQIGQNLVKNMLGSVFSDETVKEQGLDFVNKIIQDEGFVKNILVLLLSALKNPEFMKGQALQGSGKQLTVQLLEDEELKGTIKHTLADVFQSAEVKESLIKLIQSAFSSEESTRAIVQLLKKGIQDDEVKQALSGTVNYAVQELLKDEETLSQLKIFIFFLLRKFESDEEIKSMMDILFAKGLGLTKKKKDGDLQKLLKNMDRKGGEAPRSEE